MALFFPSAALCKETNLNDFLSTINLAPPPDSVDRTRVHCHPNMPKESLQNAKNSFACTASDERDVVFIDTAPRGFLQKLSSGTLFSKPGSTGLLVTDRAIYDGSFWKYDPFLPIMQKRFIPLKLIRDVTISEWFGGKMRLMVNNIPLFGQNPPAFAGVEDAALLDWCSKQLIVLVSEARGKTTPSVKDVVMSYQSFLASKSSFLGSFDLYYAGRIPSAYVENAKNVYLKLESADEEILFFYNDSGKGKGGVVLTDRNLFSHEAGHDFFFKWALTDIRRVWIGANKAGGITYLYVIVNDQRVFGWPHTRLSQSGGRNYAGILRPALFLAALICKAVTAVGGPQLSMPTTITNLRESEVDFRISEGQNY